MPIYKKYADSPDGIKLEGQEITLKFIRNGDGTGTITWNIPNIASCDVNDLAYDGIVITVSDKPANYLTSSPQNGIYFVADPTFDPNIFTGDKINVACVVGAFYHDRTTTSITVTDVLDQTRYYISAYAVDQIATYHREGVHAYSLPASQEELDHSSPEREAFHDIQIDTPEGVEITTNTGLSSTEKFTLKIEINGECHEFDDLLGSDLQTFEDLAATINLRLIGLVDPLLGPQFPNEGLYRVDEPNQAVFQWDGEKDVLQDSIFLDEDPAVPVLGTHWFKPSTGELSIRETSGWALITTIIEFPTDPSQPTAGTIWLDKVLESNGSLDTDLTFAWEWNGATWCKLPTVISTRSPLLPPILISGDYWHNTGNGETFRRNPELRLWEEVNPIVWDTDPNTIADNDYWFSSEVDLVFIRLAGVWEELNNIRFEERNELGELDFPVANHYWFIPSEQLLFQRDPTNTFWTEINVIISFNDPTDRESCDLWWNVSPSIDTLFVWDEVNNEWDAVNSFTQSATDPALPTTLEDNTIWFNPVTEDMQQITGLNCTSVIFICSSFEPTGLPVGFIWRDTTNNVWSIWDGTEFVLIDVIISEGDPFDVFDGVFWFDTDDDKLFLRVAGVWEEQEFSTESLAPEDCTFFFDTINNILLKWSTEDAAWSENCGLAEVLLNFNRQVCFNDLPDINTDLFSPFNDIDRFGRDIVQFKTCNTGCNERIEVDQFSTVFTKLNVPVIWLSPATGRSMNEAGPTYEEIDAGDDGSPDERRRLQDQIRVALGAPSIEVELSKQQLDECVDNALLMVRKYSSYAYRHDFFFLDVFPNQQKYVLTNKCVGFHRVININAAFRMRTGFLGASHGTFGGYDIYGYAALQQLYSLGTFDTLSYHLVASYIEELQYLFADQLVYTFYEDNRVLSFHQIFYNTERILLDAFIELPEQQIMTNRFLVLWIKKWAIAEAKMILSQIRGKYTNLPGPSGSTTLNSQELITQAENEKVVLMEEMKDRSMQDHNSDVMSQFWHG